MPVNVRGYIAIAAIILAALGGAPARAQVVVFNDINKATLTVNGLPVKQEADGDFVFSKTYNDSAFTVRPRTEEAGELVFLAPPSQGGGVSDIFRYVIDPLPGHFTHIHIRFASSDDGHMFGHLKKANVVDEPFGFVPIGIVDPTTNVNYEFFDKSGKDLALPDGLTISVDSGSVPEPSTTASLGVFSGLLVFRSVRLRKRLT